MIHRILSLLLFTLIVTSAFFLVATRYSKGEAISSAEEKRMKVLRRKGQLKLTPTARERTSFNKGMQEERRELEEKIPKNVPIKVKLRSEKERSFKDLKNGNWLRDFELQVTNTSDKPIYFLELWLMLPDTKTENDRQLAFPLRYGRADFIDFDTRPVAGDIPIQPRETYVFTIPEAKQQAWQQFKLRRNEPDPRKVEIHFVQLSFGDGSGFSGEDPYPYKREQSSTVFCREGPKQTAGKAFSNRAQIPFPALQEHSSLLSPAAFVPVKFSVAETIYREAEPGLYWILIVRAQTVFLRRSPLINVCVIVSLFRFELWALRILKVVVS
jgi:hypothetical protein